MKIKRIEQSSVTKVDIAKYKELVQQREGMMHTANDVEMNKRIVTFRPDTKDTELTLVNPRIVEGSDNAVVYFEKDNYKDKIRKTVRLSHLVIETDNLGKMEFKSDKNNWKNADEFMEDAGLFESVHIQKLIDAIDGIELTHPSRQYKETVSVKKKLGRNERVMLQSAEGEMAFVKAKQADSYYQMGYRAI